MKLTNKLFTNIFDDRDIIPGRLREFAGFALAQMEKDNLDGKYDMLIATLKEKLESFSGDINEIDTGINEQKKSTRKTRAFVQSFVAFMTKKAPFIAEALGGVESDGYLSVYPNGVSEYHKATYGNMKTLTYRVQVAAKANEAKLGPALAEPMMAFSPDFKKQISSHNQQTGAVKGERASRNKAAGALQIALTTTVYTVAGMYPGNEAVCAAMFPFRMLYRPDRKPAVELTGSLMTGQSRELLNYSLTTQGEVLVRNTGNNADVCVWRSLKATDGRPAAAVVVKAGESKLLKAAKLGPAGATFIMIGNLSGENAASYDVKISGLRKRDEIVANEKPAAADNKDISIAV